MANKEKFYITTAIDYVNGAPHIGHAFEKVLADAIARWNRLQGKEVFFLTGTDENAPKNAQTAKELKIPTKELVDKNSKLFEDFCKTLNISYDNFIRTSKDKNHKKKSQELFQKAYDSGDIYLGKYEGHYCEGCEEYKTEKDLIDGKCPEHNKAPKFLSEEVYFFKLSKYQSRVEKFIADYIVPKTRKNEIVSRIKEQGLKDIAVSRQGLDWGIPVPFDNKHTIYVWFDALINYISGAEDSWPADLHVVGKGINWFHSVIWPAMLFSTKITPPKELLVHGYLNLQGSKISKSQGKTIDPVKLSEDYGSDSVRYSLLRCSVFEDSDYSEEILIQRHNDELANKLGNLVSRTSTLAEKYGLEETTSSLDSKQAYNKVKKLFETYETDKAISEIFAFIDKTNEHIQQQKPWETKDKKVLYEIANAIKDASILLSPFIPETSEKIAKIFNFKISLEDLENPLEIAKIKKGEILFKKI